MAMKKADPPEGAPDWLVTYGDMMTLLLCFFVLMFAFTVEDSKKYEEVKASLKKNLGVPTEATVQVIGKKKSDLVIQLERSLETGGVLLKKGPFSVTVHALRSGFVIRLGGQVLFEQGRARLVKEAESILQALMTVIKGSANIIEIRGHTSGEADDAASSSLGKWDLSWERAYTILNYMIANGEDETRFRVVGASRFEPVAENFVEAQQQERNRRIELIVRKLGED